MRRTVRTMFIGSDAFGGLSDAVVIYIVIYSWFRRWFHSRPRYSTNGRWRLHGGVFGGRPGWG